MEVGHDEEDGEPTVALEHPQKPMTQKKDVVLEEPLEVVLEEEVEEEGHRGVMRVAGVS